ncbi:methylated-DNA--[protein]-cysteine S-methyltransferase [Sulfurivirga caldicuralii]|uniref:methylated-DNA--[protein]-cysteine S-methyltransferase n=1 Tax=Sulfurivirga caldicuralii TaxID=364032 RepID=UPI0009416BFC|nr:methylated-DNA--[protein]-cysteine S-methyltransferase [Sulfurivirga caldicuralii]
MEYEVRHVHLPENLGLLRVGFDEEGRIRQAIFATLPEGLALSFDDFMALPVVLGGTEFQQALWHGVQSVPAGEVRSYQWLARQVGRPRACRAVANALAANPVAVRVPCHRIIRSDGGLGGYAWGEKRKAGLLAWEKAEWDK